MQNMHRQYIINKFLRTGDILKASSFTLEDIKQLLLMISNVHDDHEVQSEDIKLPITYRDGEFHLQTCKCWSGCGRFTVAASHPTYCEVCEEDCENARQSHEMEVNRQYSYRALI